MRSVLADVDPKNLPTAGHAERVKVVRRAVFVVVLCEEVGLKVRVDAAGNIFARWVGSDPNLPAVATGSHTDQIPHAGLP